MPSVDARVRHSDVDHREHLGQSWQRERGGTVLHNFACDLVVEPRRHAEIVGTVIAPIDADPLLFGGALPPGYRAVLAHFFEVLAIVEIGEIVGQSVAREAIERLMRRAGETLHIAPDRPELKL